jgi:hypothetical protein
MMPGPFTTCDRQPGMSRQAMIAPAPGDEPGTVTGAFGMPHVCRYGLNGSMNWLHESADAVPEPTMMLVATASAPAPNVTADPIASSG